MLQWITLLSYCCSCFFRIDSREWGCSVKRQEYILLLLIAKFISRRRVYQTAFPLAQLVSHFHNMEIFFLVSHIFWLHYKIPFKAFHLQILIFDRTPWAVSPQAYITGSLHLGTIVSNSYRMWNTCHPNPVLDLVSPKSVPGQALDQTETQGAQWLPPLRDRHSLAAIVHPV